MRIEYDSQRDLLYLRVAERAGPITDTRTVAPGVHADFDDQDRLVGIEVLDARELLGADFRVELKWPPRERAAAG